MVEDGGGTDFPVGSRVMFFGAYGAFEDGTYREWVSVRKEDLCLIPDNVDDVSAAGIPVAYLTAQVALTLAGFRAGKTVLAPAIGGSTGDTGGYTVEQLLERGHAVRALAHREDDRSKRLEKMGAEVVIGDFLKFNDVRAAMRGVRGAYFCYPIRPGILQATAYFAQAAKEAGLECVVNMSQKSAREDALSHAAQDHWLSEQVFDWSGITAAHLRPTYFAEWLLYLAPMIRAGVLHVPFGTGRHAPIAAEDQARVIVGILENPNPHRRQVYPLYGPVEFTYAEIAQVLSRVLGWEVQYKQVSIETMLTMMASGGQKPPPGHNARALYGEFEPKPERQGDSFAIQHLREVAIDHQNGIFAGTNDLIEKIGGRPPMTLEEFINKHRAAFAA